MLRYIPLLVIVLGIDFLALPIVNYWISDLSDPSQTIILAIHFIVPFVLVGLLSGNDVFRWRKKHRVGFVRVYSFFQLTYICKVIGLIVLALLSVLDLGIGLLSYVNLDLGSLGSFKYLFATIVAAIPFILLPYGILFNRHRYQVRRIAVPIDDLPSSLEGLKIVQISDIHSGSFFDAQGFEKGVDMINRLEPDLIFFTGDLVNNRAVEFLPFVDTFNKLKAQYGVFSVLGNHDYGDYVQWRSSEAKTRNLNQLIDIQQSMGWRVLMNEHEIIDIGDSKVGVLGVENYSAKLRFPKYGDLDKAIDGIGTTDLQLLLSHDPSHWKYQIVNSFRDIDITFSGHTHGMQFGMEIGSWKWSPIKYVYKEWAGLYQDSHQFLYVNRGFGVLGYPGRVGILPEITFMSISKSR